MAKVDTDKFLELLERSELLEPEQLARVLDELRSQRDGSAPPSAEQWADQLVERDLITRWQANNLLAGKHKGFRLGKYKLLRHLGTGGMSSVYLAEHRTMRHRVAIKVLPRGRVEDSSYLARFQLEAQAAAALNHRNIVRAYDIDNDGKTHYLVMEYVEGTDLQRTVKEQGPLEYRDAAEFVAQAAEGLQHAHDAGLIHRDIKPANLLLDERNKHTVKILDMGLAKFTDSEQPSLTIAYDENVLGTADYLAPEQAINSHGVDLRADLYSLGCTLYFLLTGHPPFCEGTLPQRLMKHQTEMPPSIYEDRPDAPRALVEICLRMMVKSPENRYQTAGEVARDLRAWLADPTRMPVAAARQTATRADAAGGGGTGSDIARKELRTRKPDGGYPRNRRPPTPGGGDTLSATDSDTVKAHSAAEAELPHIQVRAGDSGKRAPSGSGARRKSAPRGKQAAPRAGEAACESSGEFVFGSDIHDTPRGASSGPSILNERLERRRNRPTAPVWIWAVMGAGLVLALVLLALVLNQ